LPGRGITVKVLMVGDIVGSPGRMAFARVVARMKDGQEADFVVANAENAAGGNGLTRDIARDLFSVGADVLTLGDHTWDQKDFAACLDSELRIARPANFPPGCPGSGCVTVESAWGPVTVINLVGRVFMPPNDCPFRSADAILRSQPASGRIILVDMHAEATSEKIVMGRYLDGRVACVAGTHTHVQTSDETVLPKKTAYITDLGMTGPKDSVIGRDLESVTQRFLTGMPTKFKVAENDVVLEGAIIDVDEKSGRARSIRRLRQAA
jgi:2',3'-cyclic-nucleotide 2'-phosphodiesterase